MIQDSLLPKGMSGDQFADALQGITGLGKSKSDMMDSTERRTMAGHLSEAISAYVDKPGKRFQEKIEAFLKTSDLPVMVTDSFDLFTDTTNFDLQWQLAFKDATNRIEPGRDYWEIATMSEFGGWQLIPEGHSVEIQTTSGTEVKVQVAKYGNGIAFTDEMIRFRKIGPMLDLVDEFRKGYWRDKSDRHYQLLAQAAHDHIEPTVGSTSLNDQWIDTLNTGAFNLLHGLKDTRNLSDGTEILWFITPQYKAKALKALSTLNQGFAQSPNGVVYNVRPIFSFNSNITGLAAFSGNAVSSLMVVPGEKSQAATLMQPTFFEDNDIMNLSFIKTAFSYYGAACHDPNQILQVDLP